MRYLLLVVLFFLAAGCTRETARAAIQADQAIDAGSALVVQAASAEDEEARRKLSQAAIDLFAQARRSLAPAIAMLSAGEQVQVKTLPPASPEEVPAFVAAAQEQTGRAWVEVDEADTARRVVQYLGMIGSDWLSSLLLGGGGVAGIAAAALATWRRLNQWKTAATLIYRAGDRLALADPAKPEQADAIKKEEAQVQAAAGVLSLVEKSKPKKVASHG